MISSHIIIHSYTYIHISLSLYIFIYLYIHLFHIYIYICICIFTCHIHIIYIYIYIYSNGIPEMALVVIMGSPPAAHSVQKPVFRCLRFHTIRQVYPCPLSQCPNTQFLLHKSRGGNPTVCNPYWHGCWSPLFEHGGGFQTPPGKLYSSARQPWVISRHCGADTLGATFVERSWTIPQPGARVFVLCTMLVPVVRA